MARKPTQAQQDAIESLQQVLPEGCRLLTFSSSVDGRSSKDWLVNRVLENEDGRTASLMYRISPEGKVTGV